MHPTFPNVQVPTDLWLEVIAALQERIAAADYLAPEKYDDEEHEAACVKNAENAAAVLVKASSIGVVAEEEESRRQRIIEVARHRLQVDGELEINDEAIVSEGGDNGCYVMAWAWFDFEGTEFDKHLFTLGTPVVQLRFRPQVWMGRRHATTIGVEVPHDRLWFVKLEDFLKVFPRRKDFVHAHKERDQLRSEPSAPTWIRNWEGPFEVELSEGQDPWDPKASEFSYMAP